MFRKTFYFGFIVSSLFILESCSVKYDAIVNSEETYPEYVFNDTKLVRYEDNQPVFELKAQTLEQYKNTSETYGHNVTFEEYEDGQVSNNGSCDYMATDTDKEIYQLFNNIQFNNKSENTTFSAHSLKWDSKNQQLTSGSNDLVTIQKDNVVIAGKGFSASGISKTFEFSGAVEGEINQQSPDEQEAKE